MEAPIPRQRWSLHEACTFMHPPWRCRCCMLPTTAEGAKRCMRLRRLVGGRIITPMLPCSCGARQPLGSRRHNTRWLCAAEGRRVAEACHELVLCNNTRRRPERPGMCWPPAGGRRQRPGRRHAPRLAGATSAAARPSSLLAEGTTATEQVWIRPGSPRCGTRAGCQCSRRGGEAAKWGPSAADTQGIKQLACRLVVC